MARLHIGHSFVTHSFLLKGEETLYTLKKEEVIYDDKNNVYRLGITALVDWAYLKHQLTYSSEDGV